MYIYLGGMSQIGGKITCPKMYAPSKYRTRNLSNESRDPSPQCSQLHVSRDCTQLSSCIKNMKCMRYLIIWRYKFIWNTLSDEIKTKQESNHDLTYESQEPSQIYHSAPCYVSDFMLFSPW